MAKKITPTTNPLPKKYHYKVGDEVVRNDRDSMLHSFGTNALKGSLAIVTKEPYMWESGKEWLMGVKWTALCTRNGGSQADGGYPAVCFDLVKSKAAKKRGRPNPPWVTPVVPIHPAATCHYPEITLTVQEFWYGGNDTTAGMLLKERGMLPSDVVDLQTEWNRIMNSMNGIKCREAYIAATRKYVHVPTDPRELF